MSESPVGAGAVTDTRDTHVVCNEISKLFRSPDGIVRALEATTLDVAREEFVCLVGPSGCGKTTLLRILAGLERPTSGSFRIADAAGPPVRPARTAMVFQEHSLFPWLCVLDNVAFALEARGVPAEERRRLGRSWLERTGMSGFARSYPYQLSGGMRQRVAVGRAFLADAEVLLMDEPFGSLDAQMRVILQTELLQHWAEKRRTVLYVTHDIDEALLLGDRVLVMSSRPGRIVAEYRSPVPRPRDASDLGRPELQEVKWRIWRTLEAEVRTSLTTA